MTNNDIGYLSGPQLVNQQAGQGGLNFNMPGNNPMLKNRGGNNNNQMIGGPNGNNPMKEIIIIK